MLPPSDTLPRHGEDRPLDGRGILARRARTAGDGRSADRGRARAGEPLRAGDDAEGEPGPALLAAGRAVRPLARDHHPGEPRGAAAAAAEQGCLRAGGTLATAPTASDLAGSGGLLPRPPGPPSPARLRLRACLGPPHGRARVNHLRPRRQGAGRERDRRPVLVLLLVQPVQRPARERLGDDPGRLRRRHGRGGARRGPSQLAYAQHQGGERRSWNDPGSRRRGRTPSSTSPRARTRASTGRRSSWGTVGAARGSAATTRAGRPGASSRGRSES